MRIEDELSKKYIISKQNEFNKLSESLYGGSDSTSWIMSLAQSLLTSLILWQSLTIYVTTWIKIWMFTWNFKLAFGPGNIIKLLKRCCRGHECNENNVGEYEMNNMSNENKLSRFECDELAQKNELVNKDDIDEMIDGYNQQENESSSNE